ncbi:ABC transporter permease [Litorilinea aerophila]|uniref:ABC transporter permease n=1 Tax=Litorilinea aerophila TaxID=1204385 RepID=UPI001B87F034|nr:ABC transporter permease [Litorilinea aerophila]MCC9077063.1 ABC transporter permease [Litorilinea aerophila]GIV76734.1 MAG: ABC transporter permease [Litorilinea sp.]
MSDSVSPSSVTAPAEAGATGVLASRRRAGWLRQIAPLLAALAGVFLGLLAGAVLILLSGADPVAAYLAMFQGAFGGRRALMETVLKTTPLLLMGLGLTVAFRGQVWNIGGEGQYLMGALAGAVVGLGLQATLPPALVIPLMLLAGLVGGALWAAVAAFLKLRFQINEIISTLMLNYIAEYWLLYLVRVPLKDPESFLPQSAQLARSVRLPTLGDTRIHVGFLIALALVPLVYLLLWKTPLGFRIRAIGASQTVARYAGMSVSRGIVFALLFSGALAGLTGIMEVSALHTRLKAGILGGYGFSGILVALLGRLHPVGVLVAALFFAALTIGAQTMHSVYGLPMALAQVIQGLVVLFVLAADALARRWMMTR